VNAAGIDRVSAEYHHGAKGYPTGGNALRSQAAIWRSSPPDFSRQSVISRESPVAVASGQSRVRSAESYWLTTRDRVPTTADCRLRLKTGDG
jgi:hypothetical protein